MVKRIKGYLQYLKLSPQAKKTFKIFKLLKYLDDDTLIYIKAMILKTLDYRRKLRGKGNDKRTISYQINYKGWWYKFL